MINDLLVFRKETIMLMIGIADQLFIDQCRIFNSSSHFVIYITISECLLTSAMFYSCTYPFIYYFFIKLFYGYTLYYSEVNK